MRSARGFTLLEVVLTLVLLGILGTMLGPYLGGSVVGSVRPLTTLDGSIRLQSWMERIVATANLDPSDLAAVRQYVAANAPDHYAVLVNAYCTLAGTDIVADPGLASGHLLRVTIQNPATGETLTALFADHAS